MKLKHLVLTGCLLLPLLAAADPFNNGALALAAACWLAGWCCACCPLPRYSKQREWMLAGW